MKQAVLRKTLTGDWSEFSFPDRGRLFYVKNFSENPCYVSFVQPASEQTSFLVSPGMGEEVCASYQKRPWPYGMYFAIYVKGTGDIEVQSEDTMVPDDWEGE